ncbi:hypothetical protein [Sphingomonas montana]|uniref:hypothetical protein n=1 Tax=Sphingomonas montana TaxID=1843236 RepID=UPI001F0ADD48|nr:hypothetical protein [Sphingomonas montana]
MIPIQGAIAVIAVLGLTMWPPAAGAMLLVPLGTGDANMAAKMALAGKAVLIGMGPFPGSLVVSGDRSRIADQVPYWKVLILAAPPAACGSAVGAAGDA